MKDIILVCEDLLGLDIYSVLEQINAWNMKYGMKPRYRILGYISDVEAPFGDAVHSMKRLGTIQRWKPVADESYVLGMCMPESKKRTVEALKGSGCTFESVCAPWVLALPFRAGEGSVVAAYSIKNGVYIGKYVTLLGSMLTSHRIGDFSTVLRFANITGDVGESAFVGNHVYSHLGKKIGDYCIVADGSVVVKNVKDGTSVSGVPAKKVKLRRFDT